MKLCCVIWILVLWPSKTLQRSYHDSPSYMAAIVQYSPVMKSTDEEDLGEVNARNYLKIIDKANTYGIDVIVFPEASLSVPTSENMTIRRSQAASYIPDPSAKIIPCNDQFQYYRYSLKSMSCAARDHQIYVVINHREKVDCLPGEGCAADGFLIYNTNVVFDRKGQVIARYRKYSLFNEPGVNVTRPIPTTFKTDFGVTFGTFICFDLLFSSPSLNLIRDMGITDILYSTDWYDATPYLHAVETQAAWAYANDVNLMASGLSYPRTASGGKQGYIDIVSNNRRSNVLVVAEIPKVVKEKRTQNMNRDNVHVYEFTNEEISTDETVENQKWSHMPLNLSFFSTELIDANKKNQEKAICDQDLCCDFKLTIDLDQDRVKNDSNYYRYRFAIFSGGFPFSGIGTLEIKSCGVIACIDDTINSCGHLFDDYKDTITPTTFTSLEISTQNVTKQNTFFMPITFTQSMIPLNVTAFSYESHSSSEQFSMHYMKLKNPVNNLLTFAIHGRDFSKDRIEVI